MQNNNWYITSENEETLFNKLWDKAKENHPAMNIGTYEMSEREYLIVLENAGFCNVNVDFITVTNYAPDNASVTNETALAQINSNRMSSLASMEKALRLAPDALTIEEQIELRDMINKRYDDRIEIYLSGEKLWDFSNSTVMITSGVKL